MVLQYLSRKRRKRRLVGIGLPATPGDNTAITRIVQPKLRVSQPDDAQEREADSVADRVMRGTRAETAAPVTGETIQRQCPECEEEEKSEKVRRKVGASGSEGRAVDGDITRRIRSRRGAGQPLPGSERGFFEPRFGRDFSGVRVHTDGEAQQLSERINARAFTLGQDVFFNRGEFLPGQSDSRRLMAHELAHTLQQGNVQTSLLQREENSKERDGEEPYSYGPEGFRFEPGGETCEAQEVSDSEVRNHIQSNLERANDNPSTAFSYLRNEREQKCCDVDLAAAEHYMYARSQVQSGESSYSAMVRLIRGYDSIKSLIPDALIPRTGDCPPTPSSDSQTEWGLTGASDGKTHREE